MINIKRAARTVIIYKEKDEIAILEIKNGEYHKIPGGSIEENESARMAAIREAKEEVGCDIELIEKIGESEFVDPDDQSLIHRSVCFLARKTSEGETPHFTKDEMERKFKLLWVSFEEAERLFKNAKSKIPFELEVNNRDLKFIKMAREILENKK